MTGLHIAPGLTLPIDMVTEPIGILANRGRGKSYTTHALVEEIHAAGVPVVVLDVKGDWWGLRTSADGKADGLPFYIFGGDHSDVPLEPTAGHILADLVVDERVSVVLDLSVMSKTKARTFTTAFAEQLYHRNRDPLFVVVDEADVLIPQRATAETARLLGAMEDIAKRGRGRGIGMAVVTQRPQEVAKSVLDLMDTLILLGMTGPRSLKSISDWISVHVDEETSASDVMATLPALPVGQAWVWSPMQHILERVKVRRIRTFDSHVTPKAGQTRTAPAGRADLDLTALGERITATIEQAKAKDPVALAKRIRELEASVAVLQAELRATVEQQPEPVIERVEVPILDKDWREAWADDVNLLLERFDELSKRLDLYPTELPQEGNKGTHGTPTSARRVTSSSSPPVRGAGAGSSAHQRKDPPPARETRPGPGGDSDVELRSGARRMVEALGRMAPLRLTKAQWGTVAKLKTSGGTWSTYLSDIRRAGLLDENAAGYTLTDTGFAYLGGRPDPMTPEELQDHYRRILRAGAVKMFDALLDVWPDGLTREQLGEAAEIAITGGTFSTYLSDLIRNGLAERINGEITATDVVVRGANA